MAFYNRKKVNYQEAHSHNPLVLSPSDNGVDWIMMKEYVYEVGKIGSGDEIKVPEGFITDFASIPRPVWSFLPPWGKYGKAAIVHDYLYDTAIRTRKDSDSIFLEIMKNSGVNTLIRNIIYYSVRTFGWIFYNRDNKSNQVNSRLTQQNTESNANDSKRSFWVVLIIGSVLTVISPWLLTQQWFGQFFKFGEATGPIGDTVGGLTAPIIGLMSAILVYLTLHEQVKANGMQREAIAKQSQENILANELAEIREQLNMIENNFSEKVHAKQNIENVFYNKSPRAKDIKPEIEYFTLGEYLIDVRINNKEKATLFSVFFYNLSCLADLVYDINIPKNSSLARTIKARLKKIYQVHFLKVLIVIQIEKKNLIDKEEVWRDLIKAIEYHDANIRNKIEQK